MGSERFPNLAEFWPIFPIKAYLIELSIFAIFKVFLALGLLNYSNRKAYVNATFAIQILATRPRAHNLY